MQRTRGFISKMIKKGAFFAIEIAHLARGVLKKGFRLQLIISSKTGKQNLVIRYDRTSENLLITAIKSPYPNISSMSQMNQELLATGFPYDVHKAFLDCIERFFESLRTAICDSRNAFNKRNRKNSNSL